MKTTQVLGAIVLSILGVATGAQAESYQGVQRIDAVRSRAEVDVDARAAARVPVFGEASVAQTRAVAVNQADRGAVRSGAVAASRAGNLYGDAASAGVLSLGQGAITRDTVRAQARQAARDGNATL